MMQNQSELNRRRFLQLVAGLGTGTLLGCAYSSSYSSSHGEPAQVADQSLNFPLRLHSNESPYGPFPRALEAIDHIARQSHRYAGDNRDALRRALAEHYRLDPGQVLLGCGSIELLKIITEVFCSPLIPPVTAEPIYEAIEYYASLKKTHPVKVPLTADFKHDLVRMAAACHKSRGLVYICNPANPTGTILHKKALERFLNLVPQHIIVVVDEAYTEYVDRSDFESCVRHVKHGRPNVVVLRTFSKLYGLAGLRVGYALGPEKLIQAMASHRLWNNINQAGAAAALASFGDRQMVSTVRRQNAEVRSFFYEESHKLSLEFIPSETNFVMMKANRSSTELISAFKEHQILIGRRIPSLPEHIRITLGTREEMSVFFDVLRNIIKREVSKKFQIFVKT
jgi:histidinol-phosphate aminotransferase